MEDLTAYQQLYEDMLNIAEDVITGKHKKNNVQKGRTEVATQILHTLSANYPRIYSNGRVVFPEKDDPKISWYDAASIPQAMAHYASEEKWEQLREDLGDQNIPKTTDTPGKLINRMWSLINNYKNYRNVYHNLKDKLKNYETIEDAYKTIKDINQSKLNSMETELESLKKYVNKLENVEIFKLISVLVCENNKLRSELGMDLKDIKVNADLTYERKNVDPEDYDIWLGNKSIKDYYNINSKLTSSSCTEEE